MMMKASTLCLAGSLALNAVLVVGIAQSRGIGVPRLAERPTDGGSRPEAEPKQSAGAPENSAQPTASVAPTPLWAQIADADFARLADHLRAAGFPPAEARAILIEVLQERRDERSAEIAGKRSDVPYWQPAVTMPSDPHGQAKWRAMNIEFARIDRSYIDTPEALAFDEDARFQAQQRYGDLPLEKLQQLKAIENNWAAKMMTAVAAISGTPSTETTMQFGQLQAQWERQKSDEARQVLTPEEFQQWELRNSTVTNSLRWQLDSFRPTEDEYKAIFAVYQNLDRQTAGSPPSDLLAARQAALELAKPQLEAALGPQRYAEFQQATQSGNDMLTRLMVRLDLPLTKIGEVNGVRDDINQRASAIRTNTQLSPAERDAQLAALAREATQKLTTSLGSRGFNAYLGMKGDWISGLTPRPKN